MDTCVVLNVFINYIRSRVREVTKPHAFFFTLHFQGAVDFLGIFMC
jgi:hypothetical protein